MMRRAVRYPAFVFHNRIVVSEACKMRRMILANSCFPTSHFFCLVHKMKKMSSIHQRFAYPGGHKRMRMNPTDYFFSMDRKKKKTCLSRQRFFSSMGRRRMKTSPEIGPSSYRVEHRTMRKTPMHRPYFPASNGYNDWDLNQ